jgi:formylglycine-generating enzyme required for sulfatase activity
VEIREKPAESRQLQAAERISAKPGSRLGTLALIIMVIVFTGIIVGCFTLWPKQDNKKRVSTSSIGMEFVQIPAGEFMMGSPLSEKGRKSDEGPLHKVKITKSFYLQTTEVTQAQWVAIMGNNPSYYTGDDNRPVDCVSWEDVKEFLKKLSEKKGKKYRLPTEAEWEYACRAGSTAKYCFSDSEGELVEYAWYVKNCGGETHLVGCKEPNKLGLYDMHGNVQEFCQDFYAEDYYGRSLTNDPEGPSNGKYRVARGGH